MKIAYNPPDFSPTAKPITYKITEVDPERLIEVSIISETNEILGFKTFRHQNEYDVNIAGYLGNQFEIYPLTSKRTGFYNADSRVVKSSIAVCYEGEAERVESAPCSITTGWEIPPTNGILSLRPQYSLISPTGYDEISFWYQESYPVHANIKVESSKGSKEVVINDFLGENHGEPYSTNDGITTFYLNVEELITYLGLTYEEVYRITVKINKQVAQSEKESDITIITRIYNIEKNLDIHLAWINAYGMVDYYNLRSPLKTSLTANKNKFYGNSGYNTTKIVSEIIYYCQSGIQNRETSIWLRSLEISPKAWLISEGTPNPIDVLSLTESIHSDSAVSQQLSYRLPIQTISANI